METNKNFIRKNGYNYKQDMVTNGVPFTKQLCKLFQIAFHNFLCVFFVWIILMIFCIFSFSVLFGFEIWEEHIFRLIKLAFVCKIKLGIGGANDS